MTKRTTFTTRPGVKTRTSRQTSTDRLKPRQGHLRRRPGQTHQGSLGQVRGRHLDTRLLYKNFYMFASVAMLDGCQEVGRRRIQLNRKNPSVIASEEIAPALKSRQTSPEVQNGDISGPTKRTHALKTVFGKMLDVC